MDNLKPCPFCGSTNVIIFPYDPFDGYQGNLTVHRVRCMNCGAQIEKKDVLDAGEAWNTRKGEK